MIGRMFDRIERNYDLLNHALSAGLDYWWRRVMVRELLPLRGDRILDLATGTGDSAAELVRKGYRVTGVDLSAQMLMRARQKIRSANFSVVLASGYELPFRAETFDGATCAFGIRNMPDTGRALAEIHRVLDRGGKVVFLEFSMPAGIIRRPYRLYLRHVIPRLASLISQREAYEYLGDSIERFHSPDEFARLILDAGFSTCTKKPLSIGLVWIHRAVKA